MRCCSGPVLWMIDSFKLQQQRCLSAWSYMRPRLHARQHFTFFWTWCQQQSALLILGPDSLKWWPTHPQPRKRYITSVGISVCAQEQKWTLLFGCVGVADSHRNCCSDIADEAHIGALSKAEPVESHFRDGSHKFTANAECRLQYGSQH